MIFSLFFLSFSKGFLITKMIEMAFLATKFFVSALIIIAINCLSNMTSFAGFLFINTTNSRDLPVFGQIPLFFSTKI